MCKLLFKSEDFNSIWAGIAEIQIYLHLTTLTLTLCSSVSLSFCIRYEKKRIYLIRRSTGMKLVSFALSVVYHLLTNNLALKLKRSTAAIVMTHNSRHVAMAVEKCFVLVRIAFIILTFLLSFLSNYSYAVFL